MLFTACNQPEHEQNWKFNVRFTSARLLMLGQSRSILQLGWPLLSLLTVEARLARLARLVEGGSSASSEVLEGSFRGCAHQVLEDTQ